MKFHVSLVSWFHWYSDILQTYQEFQNVSISDLEATVNILKERKEWKERFDAKGRYVSILIEPEEEE